MTTAIRRMTQTDSGTYDLGPDMARELGLAEVAAKEALAQLQDVEPEADWREAEGFLGWGLVAANADGELLSIAEED